MITKHGTPIRDLDDWADRAGPKRRYQWAEDRSAMEAARAWLRVKPPSLPREIELLLSTSSAFSEVLSWEAEPEVPVPFDSFRGERPNVDLLIQAEDTNGPFTMVVEAKADEPFNDEVRDILASALERKIKNPRSNGILRVEQLAQALFSPRSRGLPRIGALRYQLMTATAAALAEAERRQTRRCVVVVHEFVTNRTADVNHDRNAADLEQFLRWLSGSSAAVFPSGQLHGPFHVPGSPLFTPGTVDLFIGKARRVARRNSQQADGS